MATLHPLRQPAARIALIYLVLGAFWIFASDSLLELVLGAPPGSTTFHTLKGLSFIATSALLLYWIIRRQAGFAEDRRAVAIEAPNNWIPLATYALFALGLILIGLTAFQTQRDQLRASSESQLRSVGELRVGQISTWLHGTKANALYMGHDSLLSGHFANWVAGGTRDKREEERMKHHMREIGATYGYANISLFDTAGQVRLSMQPDPLMEEHQGDALRAMALMKPILVDYHRHGDKGSEPMLGMVAPMTVSQDGATRVVGALFFSIPASTSMVPLISRWPGSSASGETLLGRREGTGIRVIYASRGAKIINDSPSLGPLVESPAARWLAARSAEGEQGLIPDAVDFREIPVLAFGSTIPGTPWVLVAKLDKAEVDAQVERLARVTALITTFLLLAAGLAFWLWWRGQENRQRARLLGKELERQVLVRRFETLSRYASDVILLTDEAGLIIEVNERVEEMYGYRREEVLGRPTHWLLSSAFRKAHTQPWDDALAVGRLQFEAEHQRKDGSCFPVEVSAHVIELQGARHGHLTIRDIRQRKQAEELLRMQALVLEQIQDSVTVTGLDGVITYVNESQCRATGYSQEELVGQHVVKFGNAPDADADQHDIAKRTLEQGTWRGRVCNIKADGGQVLIDLRTSLVRDDSGKPLCMVGIGTDITERIRAEQALQEREALYRGVIESSADGFWVVDTEGRLLEVNDVYCQRSGYSREELLGMRIRDLDAMEDPEETRQRVQAILDTGSNLFETRHRAKDGTVWQIEVNACYSPLKGGLIFSFIRDVQRRNRSESLLRTRLQLSDLAHKASLDELMQAALDMSELYTGSQIGFFHFVDPDQETLTLQAWSSNTLKHMCTAEGKGRHYPISHAGVWVDAVQERKPVIHNDYASLPHRKGLPEGHAPVTRELVVPILREDKVVAVLGVGNKTSDYMHEDVEVAAQLASMVMEMVSRKRMEDELKQSNSRLIEAQAIARMGNWEYDVAGDTLSWSDQVYTFLGIDRGVPGMGVADFERMIQPDDVPQFRRSLEGALNDGTPYQHEIRLMCPDGKLRHTWAAAQAAKNPAGQVVKLFGTIQDITDRKQAEARLELATHFDTLTGLPNATWLFERTQRSLGEAGTATHALLVLNIDRFAQLNESLGRAAGDQVLLMLARRWSEALPDGCLLARLGADQFAVLNEHYQDTARVIETAASMMDVMREAILIEANAHPISLTLSIGIALSPNDALDAASLLHAAEDALRCAKAEKGNQVRFFDRHHAQTAIDWFETENALRQALERDEFFLLYQPQVDANNGRTVAVEALIRWRHNDHVIAPGQFIHVVEGTDLAEPISRWVLKTACRQARQWLDRNRPLRVAVNIFSSHVTSGHLLDDARLALEESGLPPQWLELEVLESSLLKNPEAASLALRELKRLGVGLALDDFGTGYSSLGYLKHYPFDVLKIDQIFARNVTRDPEDAAIVRSTIALAHNLGMRVLAEGVETEPQLRFMARYGCDQIQGYLLSRPTTPEDVETQAMERRDLRPADNDRMHKGKGILVVEDEPIESEILQLLLENEGYAVYLAENLAGALDIMGRERIDLILCDHYLRGITGLDVLEQMRRLFPDVPRVMNSSTEEQAVAVEAINRAGIRAFLRKPVSPEILMHTLRKLLAETES
jgi:diguanylate cyclase (GGDEF)-like protein/PAS domain S-box-containing protein